MEKQKPANTIRLGRIKATIWANTGETGVWYSTQVSRVYKEGDEWKQTDSLGRDDLLLACKALDQAHTWIYEQASSGRSANGISGTSGVERFEDDQGS